MLEEYIVRCGKKAPEFKAKEVARAVKFFGLGVQASDRMVSWIMAGLGMNYDSSLDNNTGVEWGTY